MKLVCTHERRKKVRPSSIRRSHVRRSAAFVDCGTAAPHTTGFGRGYLLELIN